MAFETKALLSSLSDIAARAETVEEIYYAIQKMANVEGLVLQSYDDARKEIEKLKEKQIIGLKHP